MKHQGKQTCKKKCRWETFPVPKWKSKAPPEVAYTFLQELSKVLPVCFWSHGCNFQPSSKLPNPSWLWLHAASVILCLIPLLSQRAAMQLQMNSGSSGHEITHCNLFAYILKNEVMLVEIGCGERKEKNPTLLPAIHNLSNLLLNTAGGSSVLSIPCLCPWVAQQYLVKQN